jgi:hypothetical protein
VPAQEVRPNGADEPVPAVAQGKRANSPTARQSPKSPGRCCC